MDIYKRVSEGIIAKNCDLIEESKDRVREHGESILDNEVIVAMNRIGSRYRGNTSKDSIMYQSERYIKTKLYGIFREVL